MEAPQTNVMGTIYHQNQPNSFPDSIGGTMGAVGTKKSPSHVWLLKSGLKRRLQEELV